MPVEEQVVDHLRRQRRASSTTSPVAAMCGTFLEGLREYLRRRSTPTCSPTSATRRSSTTRPRRSCATPSPTSTDACAGEPDAGGSPEPAERRAPSAETSEADAPDVATLQDIRRRIASVREHAQDHQGHGDGRGGQAAPRQERIEALRPYAGAMVEMMRDLATYADETSGYALLQEHDGAHAEALLVITGDRGLAGAFNANVVRAASRPIASSRAQGVEIAGSWSSAARASARCASAALPSTSRGRASATGRRTPTPRPSPTTSSTCYTRERGRPRAARLQPLQDRRSSRRSWTSQILPIQPQEIVTEGDASGRRSSYHLRARRRRASSTALLPRYVEIADLPGAARVERQRAGRPHDAPCATPARAPTR